MRKQRVVIMSGLATALLVALTYIGLSSKQPRQTKANAGSLPSIQ